MSHVMPSHSSSDPCCSLVIPQFAHGSQWYDSPSVELKQSADYCDFIRCHILWEIIIFTSFITVHHLSHAGQYSLHIIVLFSLRGEQLIPQWPWCVSYKRCSKFDLCLQKSQVKTKIFCIRNREPWNKNIPKQTFKWNIRISVFKWIDFANKDVKW